MIDFNFFDEFEYKIIYRDANKSLWRELFFNIKQASLKYSESYIDYQYEYSKHNSDEVFDLSCIIHRDGKPIGLWPIFLKKHVEEFNLDSNGSALLRPQFLKSLSAIEEKKIIKSCVQHILNICNKIGIKKISCYSFNYDISNADDWLLTWINFGAKCTIGFEYYVDLNCPIEEIKSNFRRSYRSLINSGLNTWNSCILSQNINLDDWNEFKKMHFVVSGRKTRSEESWCIQYRSLERGDSFLILLRNNEQNLVGGGYFSCTDFEGVYMVGVYDRNLFHLPIGHVVQYLAMLEMKKRKIKYYNIGSKYISEKNGSFDNKLSNISHFKEGFASILYPSFTLTWHSPKSVDK